MQKVFVLNKNKQPLMPCSSRRAREFLNQGKAGVIINYKYCKTIQFADGYNYSTRKTKKKEQHFLPALKGEVSMLSRG